MNATFKKIALVSVAAVTLGACSSKQQVDVLDTTSRIESNAINTRAAATFADATRIRDDNFVSESTLPILSTRSTSVKRQLPAFFSNQYFFNPSSDRRLIDVIKVLSADTGVVITARDDVFNPTSTRISATDSSGAIDASAVMAAQDVRNETNLQVADRVQIPSGSRYSGTVEGFLDYLASVLNISWTYLHEEDRVLLTRYVEKSYRLFVPPIDGDGAGIWADTLSAIEPLLSQGGGVTVNQGAGVISVVDTKDVHQMVADHINRINRTLQHTVFFNLEVLSVTMTDSDTAGLDLSFLHTSSNSRVGLSGGGVSIPSAAGITASVISGPFSGSQLIQQNLRTKAEVSTSLSTVVRSMNNQRARVNQVDTVPVITEFTPPVVSDGIVTPGGVSLTNIDVGFTMDITPSVMADGQNMVVRLNLETSNIVSITDVNIGNDGQKVQQARQIRRNYDQIFSMRNSDTMIISGFYDRTNNFSEKKPSVKWLNWLFSSKDDSANRTYYIILLTPAITNSFGQQV